MTGEPGSGRAGEWVSSAADRMVRGDLATLSSGDLARLLDRGRATDPGVESTVHGLIAEVRERGDAALVEMAQRFDGVTLTAIEVPRQACAAALDGLDPAVRAALERAASAIETFHRAQLPSPLEVEVAPGVRLGRRAEPLGRVGVYAPGGRAAYPSSVLMGVVPARVAGVGEVVVCSPPGADGLPPAAVLAACALGGADRVFALGGAGAVAAMAYGTATVPAVDRIVGPGNAYVTEAKRQVTGAVAIDCPAGPSEVLVVADATADPDLVAIELLAQAEHDPDAAAVLVATDGSLPGRVAEALARLLPAQPRREIIERSLAARGALLTAATLGEALDFAARYAPEHLLLLVAEPRAALAGVRAAGTIFLGRGSSVAFGDYLTGANHVLPTAGLARAYGGLSTSDFLRWTTYQEVGDAAAAALAAPTATLAEAEGLPAHAAAARLRGYGDAGAGVRASAGATASGNGLESEREREGERVAAVAGESGSAAPPEATGVGEARAANPAPAASITHSPTLPLSRSGAAGRGEDRVRLRPEYAGIELYDPHRSPIAVDLSDNTSLFGAPPAARRALAELGPEAITRYPPVFADALKAALAERFGVTPENIATGCGSDDVIDSALRAFTEPGDAVAYPDPTFSMVPLFARMNAARPVGVAPGPDLAVEVGAVLAAEARVTYLCQPNNPTGTELPGASLDALAEGAAGVVLLDEAYADFGTGTWTRRAVASENVVVLRTLSKAYGLAGLRIGFAVGPARLVAEIEKSRGPYKVSAAADAAARAVLAEDAAWVAGVVAAVKQNRGRLRDELTGRGLGVWPSAANFLLLRAPAPGFAAALRAGGVAVRSFAGLPGAGDCVRVSIGPWPLMERFLEAVDRIMEREGGDVR